MRNIEKTIEWNIFQFSTHVGVERSILLEKWASFQDPLQITIEGGKISYNKVDKFIDWIHKTYELDLTLLLELWSNITSKTIEKDVELTSYLVPITATLLTDISKKAYDLMEKYEKRALVAEGTIDLNGIENLLLQHIDSSDPEDICTTSNYLNIFENTSILHYRIMRNSIDNLHVNSVEFSTNKNNWITTQSNWYENLNNVKLLHLDPEEEGAEQGFEIKKIETQNIFEKSTFLIGRYHENAKCNKLNKYLYSISLKNKLIGYIFCLGRENLLGFDPYEHHSDEGFYNQYAMYIESNESKNCIFGGSQVYYYTKHEKIDQIMEQLAKDKGYSLKNCSWIISNDKGKIWLID
jgi:hypothetical protein